MSRGTVRLRGKIRCPIYRRIEAGGRSNIVTSGDYDLPAALDVRCTGEGEEERCTATYSDCPGSVYEDGPPPTAAVRKKVSKLRPPAGVVRSRDNSGSWNSQLAWIGREDYSGRGNERRSEEFGIQVWDGVSDVHYHGAEFRRPYARADKRLERDGWHMELDSRSRRELARAMRAAAAVGVQRGNVDREVYHKSPPIRVGDEEVDWPGRGFDGRRGKRR